MGEGERPQGHKGGGKRRRGGGDDREGWSGESGSISVTSEAELEEAEEEPTPLTALPWGMQESGASGLHIGARDGGSGGGKAISGTADRGETRSRHGAEKQHGGKKGGRRGWESDDPLSAVPEMAFLPPLPPSLTPTRSPRAPLSCMPRGNAVSGPCLLSPSSDSASDVASLLPLSQLHPSLSYPPRLPSPPPSWPCGRSPSPMHPCPRPWPPISP